MQELTRMMDNIEVSDEIGSQVEVFSSEDL